MDAAATDELRALRARAYGPDADIHTDEDALRRLHELEQRPGEAAEPAPVEEPGTDAEHETSSLEDEAIEPEDAGISASRGSLWTLLSSNWRATLWAATLVVALVVAGAGLVVVQRVQADPLQVGAHQVARLSVDPRYEVPDIFGASDTDSEKPQGFREFYGLRVFLTSMTYPPLGPENTCLTVYESVLAENATDSFPGIILGGCGAGTFPASVELVVTDDMPGEILQQFPEGSALQFVLDEANDEVVVFSDAE